MCACMKELMMKVLSLLAAVQVAARGLEETKTKYGN